MKIKNLMDLTLNQINELLCNKKVVVFEYNTGTKVRLVPTTPDKYTAILHYVLHHKVIYKTKELHLVDVLFNKNLEEILQKVANTTLQRDKAYYGCYYGDKAIVGHQYHKKEDNPSNIKLITISEKFKSKTVVRNYLKSLITNNYGIMLDIEGELYRYVLEQPNNEKKRIFDDSYYFFIKRLLTDVDYIVTSYPQHITNGDGSLSELSVILYYGMLVNRLFELFPERYNQRDLSDTFSGFSKQINYNLIRSLNVLNNNSIESCCVLCTVLNLFVKHNKFSFLNPIMTEYDRKLYHVVQKKLDELIYQ